MTWTGSQNPKHGDLILKTVNSVPQPACFQLPITRAGPVLDSIDFIPVFGFFKTALVSAMVSLAPAAIALAPVGPKVRVEGSPRLAPDVRILRQ